MAAVTKSGIPSLATTVPPPNVQISGLVAGEAIAAGDACYIKSDGKVWLATGAAAAAAAKVKGFAATSATINQGVTLFWDVNFGYGTGLTPGSLYYLSGTVPGGLDTAPSAGGTVPIGQAVDATRIHVMRSLQS